ncbi:MAG: T9SS type A sorting domain-containing protein [bacterium]
MKKAVLFLFGFLIAVDFSLAQINRTDPIEFKVNEDISPSQIIQDNAMIYGSDDGRLIASWQDYRNGSRKFYSQVFDSNKHKTGNNFLIDANSLITFTPENKILAMAESANSYGISGSYWLEGKLFDAAGNFIKQFHILDAGLSIDTFSDMDVTFELLQDEEFFYWFFSDYIYFFVTKADFNGIVIYKNKIPMNFPTDASSFGSVMIGGTIYLAWYNMGLMNDLPEGVYISSFDSELNTIKETILLKLYGDSYEHHKIIVNNLKNNLIGVYILDTKTDCIEFTTFDQDLNIIGEVKTITLNFPEWFEHIPKIEGLSISKPFEDVFALFCSVGDYSSGNSYRIMNYMQYISTDSELIRPVISKEDVGIKLPRFVQPKDMTNFYIGQTIDSDVYLSTMENFQITTGEKLNDDTAGSNENLPLINKIDDERFFINYKDEKKIRGKEISAAGNYSNTEFYPAAQNCVFFDDGNILCIRETDTYNYGYQFSGFTLYNSNWEFIKQIDLPSEKIMDYYLAEIDGASLIVLLKKDNQIIFQKYNSSGELILEKNVGSASSGELKIFPENPTSFWAAFNSKLQLYSIEFEILSDAYNSFAPMIYLGNNKFLFVYGELDPSFISHNMKGYIADQCHQKIGEEFLITQDIAINDYPVIQAVSLSNNFFIITNEYYGTKIEAKIFDVAGNLEKSFDITGAITGTNDIRKIGTHLIVTWDEIRNPEFGYDIFCKIYDIDDLITGINPEESVPNEFHLYQNYPNPFNPTTVISWQLAASSNVSIKIFDVLGREITMLVDEFQNAGFHQIEFDAGKYKLTSGVYFYKIITGEHSDIKKFVLLK